MLGGEVALSLLDHAAGRLARQGQAGKARRRRRDDARALGCSAEVPTMKEAGLPDFELVLYSGILGPRGVPAAIVDRS